MKTHTSNKIIDSNGTECGESYVSKTTGKVFISCDLADQVERKMYDYIVNPLDEKGNLLPQFAYRGN